MAESYYSVNKIQSKNILITRYTYFRIFGRSYIDGKLSNKYEKIAINNLSPVIFKVCEKYKNKNLNVPIEYSRMNNLGDRVFVKPIVINSDVEYNIDKKNIIKIVTIKYIDLFGKNAKRDRFILIDSNNNCYYDLKFEINNNYRNKFTDNEINYNIESYIQDLDKYELERIDRCMYKINRNVLYETEYVLSSFDIRFINDYLDDIKTKIMDGIDMYVNKLKDNNELKRLLSIIVFQNKISNIYDILKRLVYVNLNNYDKLSYDYKFFNNFCINNSTCNNNFINKLVVKVNPSNKKLISNISNLLFNVKVITTINNCIELEYNEEFLMNKIDIYTICNKPLYLNSSILYKYAKNNNLLNRLDDLIFIVVNEYMRLSKCLLENVNEINVSDEELNKILSDQSNTLILMQ